MRSNYYQQLPKDEVEKVRLSTRFEDLNTFGANDDDTPLLLPLSGTALFEAWFSHSVKTPFYL